MNSLFRAKGQFNLLIRFIVIVNFTSINQLLPIVNALNGVIWDEKSAEFVKIFSIKQFAKINDYYFSLSRAIEKHNFNGTRLRITSWPVKNLFELYDNDTKSSGAIGEMWEILSEMLNFRISYKLIGKTEVGSEQADGSWTGMIGYIYRNETDVLVRCMMHPKRSTALEYTMPIWQTSYRFHIKKQLEYDGAWMARLFSPMLWTSVIGLFFTLSIASFSFQILSYKGRKNSRDNSATLINHFFYVFSLLCNQGYLPPQLSEYSKILTISTQFCAWLIYIAFNSKLISHITHREFREPFNSLETLYEDTDYKVLMKHHSHAYLAFHNSPDNIYKQIMTSKRLVVSNEDYEVYVKICTGKYAFLEATDISEAANSRICEFSSIGKKYYSTWISSGLIRGFKYKKAINLGILKLREIGLMNRLKSTWLIKNTPIPRTDVIKRIELEHVSLIFSMLFCAIILCLVILLIENIVSLKMRRKR